MRPDVSHVGLDPLEAQKGQEIDKSIIKYFDPKKMSTNQEILGWDKQHDLGKYFSEASIKIWKIFVPHLESVK